MGHNIHYNERTGKHSFFSVKLPAWHKLGKVVEDYPTSKEAIQFAGLDYEVVKAPLFTKWEGLSVSENGLDKSSTEIPIPHQFATMRTDTQKVFGVVGKDYGIVQNRDAFSFFDAIIKEGKGVKYETAGALGDGERVFITAKLPDGILVGKEDLIEQYLFLTTSHDGTGSITAAFFLKIQQDVVWSFYNSLMYLPQEFLYFVNCGNPPVPLGYVRLPQCLIVCF
ncbi:hypothetical protein GCM10028791_08080 [Echinicola sediminis]